MALQQRRIKAFLPVTLVTLMIVHRSQCQDQHHKRRLSQFCTRQTQMGSERQLVAVLAAACAAMVTLTQLISQVTLIVPRVATESSRIPDQFNLAGI